MIIVSYVLRRWSEEQARRYDAQRKALMDHSGTSFERNYEAVDIRGPWDSEAMESSRKPMHT